MVAYKVYGGSKDAAKIGEALAIACTTCNGTHWVPAPFGEGDEVYCPDCAKRGL
jgi:DNA-directed RNA polymerase subunit RPC12/RpoP